MIAAVGNHQIVEDAAPRIGEQRIALPSLTEPQQIDRLEGLQRTPARLDGVLAGGDRDLPHVRHVEKAGRRTRVQMLLEDAAGKLDRHLIPCEGHEAGAELDMEIMKRGTLQSGT